MSTSIGRWRILSVLGRGGFATVYQAEEEGTGRLVALKVLAPTLAQDERVLARFALEGRALAQLSHPNLVRVIEVGEASGSHFIVLEYLPGGTLASKLRHGRLDWKEATRLGAGIARGLAALHAIGLVHRDVKPANVLLDAAGEPRLSDLGLVHGPLSTGEALTRTGEVVGTLEFLSPEQANASAVTASADLYGLGATLFRLITGDPVFSGRGYSLMKQHLLAAPRWPRELTPETPEAVARLVLRLLSKNPRERGTALEAAAALSALARGHVRRGRGLWIGGVVALGALLAFAVLRPATPPDVAPVTTKPVVKDPTPAWYLATQVQDRPAQPLPPGMAFRDSPGEYVNEADGSVLVYVPGGEFDRQGEVMGTIDRDRCAGFFIGKYEVSNALFTLFVHAKNYRTDAESETGEGTIIDNKGDTSVTKTSWQFPHADGKRCRPDEPVVQVTWEDARNYCLWAKLRLPTEREWEKAAYWDGTNVRAYPWGDVPPVNAKVPPANLGDTTYRRSIGKPVLDADRYDDHVARLASITSFPNGRSPWGAFNMVGNVEEWIEIHEVANFYTHGRGEREAIAGGAFNDSPGRPESEKRRRRSGSNCAVENLGFRVARGLEAR